MPSISKTALDELNERVRVAEARSENERQEKIALRAKVSQFDDILDKLIKAANGYPLVEERGNTWGMTNGYSIGSAPLDQRLTDAERQAIEQERLRERLNGAESRLAAVVAVAQFAKAHKA